MVEVVVVVSEAITAEIIVLVAVAVVEAAAAKEVSVAVSVEGAEVTVVVNAAVQRK